MNYELQIAKALKGLDNENLEHLEHIDGMEDLEHLAALNPNIAHAVAQLKRTATAGTHIGSFRAPKSAATATINIQRKLTVGATSLVDGGGNIVFLPAPLFGVLEFENLYYRVINGYLPQDGSVQIKSVALTTDKTGIVITYKNTADNINETITITATGTPYTNLLRSLMSMAFTIVQPKMRISDSTQQTQFEQQIGTFKGSAWGKREYDYVVPNDYESDLIQKDNVRVLSNTFSIDPERALVPLIANTAQENNATFLVGLTCYIQEFRKFAEYANAPHKHLGR